MREIVFRVFPALVAVLAVTAPVHAQPAPAPVPTTAEVARQFYDAFVRGDHATMERLYAPDVKFQDTIFGFQDRDGTMGMWRTIINPGPEARFRYELQTVAGNTAVVRWIADYSLLGNPIHNEITARLTIVNGRIVNHVDAFPWEVWARQAFPQLGGLVDFAPIRGLLKGSLNLFLRARITWDRITRAWRDVREMVRTIFTGEERATDRPAEQTDSTGRTPRQQTQTRGALGALGDIERPRGR